MFAKCQIPYLLLALCHGLLLAADGESTIRLASQPALSPDGARLAFSWLGDLWLVDSAGGAARRVTTAVAKDEHPLFSPDGRELAFISDRSGSAQLHLVTLETGETRQVTTHTEGCDATDWFPDGQRL